MVYRSMYSETMSDHALPRNQEDREVYLREHNAGNFIEAVRSTQTKKADTLIGRLFGANRNCSTLP